MSNAYIFIGRSGSGKGTQGALLDALIRGRDGADSLIYLETGRLFREFIKADGESNRMAKAINEVGGLQPEFLTVHLWSNFFVKNFRRGVNIITDGTPRKLLETGVLDTAFSFYGFKKPYVVFLNTSVGECKKRLLARGRADDTPEDINSRLAWYETDVAPSVDFYRNNPNYNFCDVNGDQSVEDVFEDIKKQLGL